MRLAADRPDDGGNSIILPIVVGSIVAVVLLAIVVVLIIKKGRSRGAYDSEKGAEASRKEETQKLNEGGNSAHA